MPLGFQQTFPNHPVIEIFPPPPGGGVHDIRLEGGQSLEGVDFGNRPVATGSVHGIKWVDENGNGRRDDNEVGIGGVTIYADLNFNGRLDFGEPSTVTMAEDPLTDFDEGGLYWLETQAGLQSIREIVPDGFEQTFPLSDALVPWEAGAHFVHVDEGGTLEGVDFGNRRIVLTGVPEDASVDGDFNRDDAVDQLDLAIWENAFQSGSSLSAADGHGQRTSGALFLEWQRNFSPSDTDLATSGDFDGDGVVTRNDVDVWQQNYRSESAGDAGPTDAMQSGLGFLAWQRRFGQATSSPHVPPQAAATTLQSNPTPASETSRTAVSAGMVFPAPHALFGRFASSRGTDVGEHWQAFDAALSLAQSRHGDTDADGSFLAERQTADHLPRAARGQTMHDRDSALASMVGGLDVIDLDVIDLDVIDLDVIDLDAIDLDAHWPS